MDKDESCKFFENWLRAYADHLHLVRQGHRVDLVTPDAAKPPVSATKIADISVPSRKSTS
jgi:hypothetical protein